MTDIKNYCCKPCNYSTPHKFHYERHLKSKSHFKISNLSTKEKKNKCNFCGKIYLHSSSLYRHKKKCKKKEEKKEEERLKNDIITSKDKEIAKLRKMLEDEKRMNKKKQEQMIEIAKNAGNKNTFNIQVFLNDKCKNAMPIMEFVKDLQFKLTDINPERPASTIESLSKCITDKLDDMEETEKPIYCTDQKRLVFHVKDASGWTKDINNKKIDNAIGWANVRHQGAWIRKAKADDWVNQKNDTNYLNMNVAMGKFSDNPKKAKMKIKRAIAKHTTFPKNWSLQKPTD